ncbi:HdeD family acid-resistance protein [Streptomyces sp. B5E4]|uniref:HdeD family acid-resistance protein n=1 Tax=Streptomyces sp. B5E4 TaxID=3153568 RepID=UPI00325D4CC7
MSTEPAPHGGRPEKPGDSADEGIRPVGDRTRRVDDPLAASPATPRERRLSVVEGDEHAGPPPGGGAERTAHREREIVPEGPLGLLARGAWQAVLLAGVAALVLGVLALAWPGETLRVVGILFGLYLLVIGVMQLVAAFGTHASTGLRVMAFISGALCILLGLLCFRSALQSVLLLALWIGIGWLFRGITQAVAAGSDEAMPARGWQIGLGVISALAGIVLIVSPLTSIAILTYLTGAWLLAVGVIEIATAVRIRHRAKQLPAGA